MSSTPTASASTPMLSIDFVSTRDDFTLEVALDVAGGEVLVVIGPNGSGKSTLLSTIAGLELCDRGHVTIDGITVDSANDDRFVKPAGRRVGMVFQEYVLFEHLSALDNVAFGPRCAGAGRRAARETALGWLQRLELEGRANDLPRQLSGGQQQRVALARALATTPDVLLLDEPLAALDVEIRDRVRRELRQILTDYDGACIVVTHDPLDVYALADRVAVIDRGRVVQLGTLAELTAHPRSRFVAELVGTNLVSGVVDGQSLRSDGGMTLSVAADFDGPAFAAIRPSSIILAREVADTSARNNFEVEVGGIDRLGERVRVTLDGPLPLVAEITAGALDTLALRPGDRLHASVKATDIQVYPA